MPAMAGWFSCDGSRWPRPDRRIDSTRARGAGRREREEPGNGLASRLRMIVGWRGDRTCAPPGSCVEAPEPGGAPGLPLAARARRSCVRARRRSGQLPAIAVSLASSAPAVARHARATAKVSPIVVRSIDVRVPIQPARRDQPSGVGRHHVDVAPLGVPPETHALPPGPWPHLRLPLPSSPRHARDRP
jgi:hypothetical protein